MLSHTSGAVEALLEFVRRVRYIAVYVLQRHDVPFV